MLEEVVFAGFGGQGVLLAAQLLTTAAMIEDYQVAWIPSYGPEMRGGTAYAASIISDTRVWSLVVEHPSVAVILNQPSFDTYVPRVKEGGLVLYNSSLIKPSVVPSNLRVIAVPATQVAAELGNNRLTNMVMLGATISAMKVVTLEGLFAALEESMKGPKERFIESNKQAITIGMGYGTGSAADRPA